MAVPYAKGDLANLAASFNLMLASLTRRAEPDVAPRGRRRPRAADPLTSLRANVDLLAVDLRRTRSRSTQKGLVLRDLQGQLGELTEMIGDLVHVARDDTALDAGPPGRARRRQGRASSGSGGGRRAPRSTSRSTRSSWWATPTSLGRAVDQPARQRGEVEPAGRVDRGPARGQPAAGLRRRPGHRRGRSAVRLRPLLPRRVRAQDEGHGPRPGHRGQGGRGDGGHRDRGPLGPGRGRVRPAAPRGHDPRGRSSLLVPTS